MARGNEEFEAEGGQADFWQMVELFSVHVKSLALAGLAAAALGWGCWFVVTPWKAVQVISVAKLSNEMSSIDYVTWRHLAQNLPLLARQQLDSGRIKDASRAASFVMFADPAWWAQSVVPNYLLTKADVRNLATVSKQMQESVSDAILSISVSGKGRNPEELSRRLELTADFIQQGAAYLAVQSLLASYQFELSQAEEFRRQILLNEVELGYLHERVAKMEKLRAKLLQPKGGAGRQSREISGDGFSDAPLEPQLTVDSRLVAIHADIHGLEEKNQRLHERLAQLELKERFLKSASPLLESEANGLQLIDQLLNTLSMREDSDIAGGHLLTAASIRHDLAAIQVRYSSGLKKQPINKLTRPGPLPLALGGGLVGALLMLLWIFMREGWKRHRATGTSS